VRGRRRTPQATRGTCGAGHRGASWAAGYRGPGPGAGEHSRACAAPPLAYPLVTHRKSVTTLARLDPRGFVFGRTRTGPAADALRRLRGALCFDADGRARRRIGVAALGGGPEGARVAAELALAFEGEGRPALLVEGWAEAGLAARLELEPAPGLSAALHAGSDWRTAVAPSALGPRVLAWGSGDAPDDALAGPRAEALVAELPGPAEVAVLALPSAEALLATPGVLRSLDVLCLVHRARSQPRARVAATVRALHAAGLRALAGVLLERAS